MEREQKDNTGVLFKNGKKTKESQPDWQGMSMIDGVEKWVSVWVNKSRDGNTVYMKMAYAEPMQRGSAIGNADLVTPASFAKKNPGWEPDHTPLDDEVPF